MSSGSGDGSDLLVIRVHGGVVVPAIEGEELVIVVLLSARVVDVRADLVAGDDGSDTTAGSTLAGRHGDHCFGTSRNKGEGGGASQSESREVLHDGRWSDETKQVQS